MHVSLERVYDFDKVTFGTAGTLSGMNSLILPGRGVDSNQWFTATTFEMQ